MVLVLEELCPRIDDALDRELSRMVVVEELGKELVVGSGCLYVDARSVIAPFALSDLRIYLERIVDGMQAHFGSMIVFSAIVESRHAGVDVDGFLGIVHESVGKDRLVYLQRNAQHALQNLGRSDFSLEGEMVLRTPVYLAYAGEGRQFAGYQVGETLGEGSVIVLAIYMDAGERCFEVEIAVLALVLGAYGDVVEAVGLVGYLQSQDGRQQMLYMGCCGILLARDRVGAFYLDVGVRVGDGCESLYQSLVIAAVYLNVAVAVLVEIEARNAALGIEMLLVAVSRKRGSEDAELPVVEYAAQVDALGVDACLELGASLFGLDGNFAHIGLQLAMGAYFLAGAINFTYIIYVAQAQHFLRDTDAFAQISGNLSDAIARYSEGSDVCLPAQHAVPIAHTAVSPEQQTAALSLELEVMDAGRCTGARKLEMKLQGILELTEFRHEAGNIGKRDDGWLDAALKLEGRLHDMLVLDAVGSAQVIKLQLRMRKLDAEVSEQGLLLVGIEFESQILELKS